MYAGQLKEIRYNFRKEHAVFGMRYAVFGMRYAVFGMRYARH